MNEAPVDNEFTSAKTHSRPHRVAIVLTRRWLREPLLHFMLLGFGLFGAFHYLQSGQDASPSSKQIVLSLDELTGLAQIFQSQWKRAPTVEEFNVLVERQVNEEVLYREALALGLDKDDTIIKRRLAQKLEFVTEDIAAAHEPSPTVLKTWYEKNAKQFALPSRVSFRHLYFSPDRRGKRARDEAANARVKLTGQAEDSSVAGEIADPFMFQDYYRDRTPEQLSKEFGPQFALDVEKLPSNSWQGPIESGLGWHLVFVDSVVPGRVPAFEEIEADIKSAWLEQQKAVAWQESLRNMRAKYTVLIPSLPKNALTTVSSATSKSSALPVWRGVE